MCENIYEIPDDNALEEMSWAYDMTYCDKCGYNSYEVLIVPEKKSYIKSLIQDKKKKLALDNNYDQRIEDMKHTMALFKEELNELIETYLNPWLK